MHNWTHADDLMVCYLFRFGTTAIPYNNSQIAQRIGVSTGGLRYRISNFKAASGNGGAQHYGKLTKQVLGANQALPELQLRYIAFPELIPVPQPALASVNSTQ